MRGRWQIVRFPKKPSFGHYSKCWVAHFLLDNGQSMDITFHHTHDEALAHIFNKEA